MDLYRNGAVNNHTQLTFFEFSPRILANGGDIVWMPNTNYVATGQTRRADPVRRMNATEFPTSRLSLARLARQCTPRYHLNSTLERGRTLGQPAPESCGAKTRTISIPWLTEPIDIHSPAISSTHTSNLIDFGAPMRRTDLYSTTEDGRQT